MSQAFKTIQKMSQAKFIPPTRDGADPYGAGASASALEFFCGITPFALKDCHGDRSGMRFLTLLGTGSHCPSGFSWLLVCSLLLHRLSKLFFLFGPFLSLSKIVASGPLELIFGLSASICGFFKSKSIDLLVLLHKNGKILVRCFHFLAYELIPQAPNTRLSFLIAVLLHAVWKGV